MKELLMFWMTIAGMVCMLIGIFSQHDYMVTFGGFVFIAGEIRRLARFGS